MPSDIAAPQSNNDALRRILFYTQEILDFISGNYDTITGDNSIDVTDAETELRAASSTSMGVVVTNLGTSVVFVYEGAHLVASLYKNQSWKSDFKGTAAITGQCLADESSRVACTTYVKN